MLRRLAPVRSIVSLLLVALVFCLPGCEKRTEGAARAVAETARPDIVIVCIDALRPDHLGCYGYARETSATIDALAAEGLLFEQAWSTSSWTKSAVPSLFTGLLPSQHRVFEGSHTDTPGRMTSDVLAEEHETMAERLASAGYRTAAFVKNAQLRSFLGFKQGFDLYVDDAGDAGEIVKRFQDWSGAAGSGPRFAYLHILDTHWPYRPRSPFDTMFGETACEMDFATKSYRTLRDDINSHRKTPSAADLARMVELYDGLIAQVDEALASLVETLRGNSRPTVLFITADHGEEFYETGKIGHGQSLSELLLHIPMIVWGDGIDPGRVAAPCSLIDLMATTCALAGVEAPAACLGHDLLAGETDPERPRVIAAERRFSSRHLIAWREGDWKLLREYKDLGPRPSDEPDLLQVGLRCEITLDEDSVANDDDWRADKLEIKADQQETGIEVQGRLGDWDAAAGTLRILGIPGRLEADARVRDAGKEPIERGVLVAEMPVEMDGSPDGDGSLVVAKLTQVPADRLRMQIEGPLEAVSPDGKSVVVELAGRSVRITKDTRVKDRRPRPEEVAETPQPPREDPMRLERLLSGEGLERHEQLFDLATDRQERHDLAASRSDVSTRLATHLARCLEWLAAHARPLADARRQLDEATIDALRETGYVH